MDPFTVLEKWELSEPISLTKALIRRREMLRHCATVPGWEGKIPMIVRAEHHVCRFLWELHHHGPMPENRFCWLVDQYLFRFAEWRIQKGATLTRLTEILGEMPPSRVDYRVEKASGTWDKYEAIMQAKTAEREEEKKKKKKKEQEQEQDQSSSSTMSTSGTAAPKK